MTSHDDQCVAAIVGTVTGLIRAVHEGDRLRVIGELNRLLAAIIEHNATLSERPDDAALRRAVARLS